MQEIPASDKNIHPRSLLQGRFKVLSFFNFLLQRLAVELCSGKVARLFDNFENTESRTLFQSRSALHIAAFYGQPNSVSSLILNQADISVEDIDKNTPLNLATGWCKIILQNMEPAKIEAPSADDYDISQTKIRSLAEVGNVVEGMRVILAAGYVQEMDASDGPLKIHDEGIIVNVWDDSDQPVSVEKVGGSKPWRYTLKALAPSEPGFAGWTLLMLAAKEGNLGHMESLISNLADVNAKHSGQQTALHIATAQGHIAAVLSLLEAKADLEIKDRCLRTVLQIAAAKRNSQIVRILLQSEQGVKSLQLGTLDSNSYAALHYAASVSSAEVAECLIRAKANLEEKGPWRQTPLHFASKYGNAHTLLCLIYLKADINATDEKGSTPLDLAQSDQCKHVLKSVGAGGWTPLMVASSCGEVLQYLDQYSSVQSLYKSIHEKSTFPKTFEDDIKYYLSLDVKSQLWVWGPKEKLLVLTNESQVVSKAFPSNPDYSSVLGTENFEDGVHTWDLHVDNVRAMWVGIARGIEENFLLNSYPTRPGEDGCVLAFSNDGGFPVLFGTKNVTIRSLPDTSYKSGDTITLHLDMRKHILKMKINGMLVVAASNVDDRAVRPFVCMDFTERITLGKRVSRVKSSRIISEEELSALNNSIWPEAWDLALRDCTFSGTPIIHLVCF